MYAVIEFKWHQYIVKEWDVITVDNIWEDEWNQIEVDRVLAVFDENGENVQVGKPYLSDSSVKCKLEKNFKGEKTNVFKFKAKNRYSKKQWFRPYNSLLKIEKLEHGS